MPRLQMPRHFIWEALPVVCFVSWQYGMDWIRRLRRLGWDCHRMDGNHTFSCYWCEAHGNQRVDGEWLFTVTFFPEGVCVIKPGSADDDEPFDLREFPPEGNN